jgi:predicted SprT family Zn-dependent metalloprotease
VGTDVRRIVDVSRFANSKLREHGLAQMGWTFVWDKSKDRTGQCRFRRREIGFSLYYVEKSSWDEITDTILHEIAHALVGPKHGHDLAWKAKCVEIGAKPMRLASEEAVTTAKFNFVIKCPSCGRKWYRYRMRRRNFGSKCPDCHVEVKIYKYVRR